MRMYCLARGTLLNALWWPHWEGNPRKRGYTYTCDYSLGCIEETNTTFESNYNPVRGFPGNSARNESRSACSAGDPGLIPGSGRDRLPTPVFLGFPGGSTGKESTCNAGDLGFIPGLGRSPGGGHESDTTEWLSTTQSLDIRDQK